MDNAAVDQIDIHCWRCGKHLRKGYAPYLRVWCERCKVVADSRKRRRLHLLVRLANEQKVERAIEALEKQEIPIYEYHEAFEVVSEALIENPRKFDSTPEVLAAVELLRNRIHIKTQRDIAGYRVDFVIPSEKVVLEIDGERHQHSLGRDRTRDLKVRAALGDSWEVVRIPDRYLLVNVRQLVPAILALRDEMKKARNANGGVLPRWFSARDRKAWDQVISKLKA